MKTNLKLNRELYKQEMGLLNPPLVALIILFLFMVFFPVNVLAATIHLKENAPEFIHKTEASYGTMVHTAALLNDADAKLILAVIVVESEGNEKVVSRKGAQGLMQLMPKTARAMGAKDFKEPFQNILAGSKYLKELEDNNGFSSPGEVLVAYNMGPQGAKRWLERHSPSEYGYVTNVLYVYHLLEEKEAAQKFTVDRLAKALANEDIISALRPLMVQPRTLSLADFPVTIPTVRKNEVKFEN